MESVPNMYSNCPGGVRPVKEWTICSETGIENTADAHVARNYYNTAIKAFANDRPEQLQTSQLPL